EIVSGIDGNHAVALTRSRWVDVPDAPVREWAAQQCRVQHAGQPDVVDEQRLAGEQAAILVARDRSTEITRRHRRSLPQPARSFMPIFRPGYPNSWLPQLLGSAQARDHGHPQQILAGASLVGGDFGQAAPELGPVGFQVALVLNRLLLDVFERHLPALPVVAFELALALRAAPNLDQPRGQI